MQQYLLQPHKGPIVAIFSQSIRHFCFKKSNLFGIIFWEMINNIVNHEFIRAFNKLSIHLLADIVSPIFASFIIPPNILIHYVMLDVNC